MLMKMPALPDSEQVAGALFVSIGLLRRRLRQQEVAGDLTFPETAALARLERCGPAVAADLARAEEISPQSMGVTLSGLQERGLIARSADPDDGVVDAAGRSHEIDNLWIVDNSTFPSALAANPALTQVALALRSAEHLLAARG